MSGSISVPRLVRAALVGFGLTCFALAPVEAAAESPAEAEESTSEAGTTRQSGEVRAESPSGGESSAMVWFYLSTLGLALTVPLGFVLYRQFRVDGDDAEGRRGGLEPEPTAEPVGAGSRQAEGGFEQVEQAFFSSGEVEQTESSTRSALEGGPERVCPECGEQFPATVMVCPHDSTPLETVERETRSASETVLERQRCPGCGRRYEPEAAFCYHDGMRLRQDTAEKADDAPVYKVCETCGWEGKRDEPTCPNDGRELTTVDPSEEERVTPPVPVMCCPECGEYGEPGQARCPEDDTVLTPLENAHTTELPANGYGPPRKICEECGETFSAAGQYCTRDGSELVAMN